MPKQPIKIDYKQDINSLYKSHLRRKAIARGLLQKSPSACKCKTLPASHLCKWHLFVKKAMVLIGLTATSIWRRLPSGIDWSCRRNPWIPQWCSYEAKKVNWFQPDSDGLWLDVLRSWGSQWRQEMDLVQKVLFTFFNRNPLLSHIRLLLFYPAVPTINQVLLKWFFI